MHTLEVQFSRASVRSSEPRTPNRPRHLRAYEHRSLPYDPEAPKVSVVKLTDAIEGCFIPSRAIRRTESQSEPVRDARTASRKSGTRAGQAEKNVVKSWSLVQIAADRMPAIPGRASMRSGLSWERGRPARSGPKAHRCSSGQDARDPGNCPRGGRRSRPVSTHRRRQELHHLTGHSRLRSAAERSRCPVDQSRSAPPSSHPGPN